MTALPPILDIRDDLERARETTDEDVDDDIDGAEARLEEYAERDRDSRETVLDELENELLPVQQVVEGEAAERIEAARNRIQIHRDSRSESADGVTILETKLHPIDEDAYDAIAVEAPSAEADAPDLDEPGTGGSDTDGSDTDEPAADTSNATASDDGPPHANELEADEPGTGSTAATAPDLDEPGADIDEVRGGEVSVRTLVSNSGDAQTVRPEVAFRGEDNEIITKTSGERTQVDAGTEGELGVEVTVPEDAAYYTVHLLPLEGENE